LAEAALEGRIDLGLQFGVLGTQAGYFGEQLPDHRLQGGNVLGQRGVGREVGGVHARSNTASAAR
jgi:hypothetical protein